MIIADFYIIQLQLSRHLPATASETIQGDQVRGDRLCR